MDISSILHPDFEALKEAMKTEHLMAFAKQNDPMVVLMSPIVLISGLVVAGGLAALKMLKTLTIIFACIGLWFAAYYTIPETGKDLSLGDVGGFMGICTGILAVVCYVFFVKGD